jgi:hypothetical protein
MPREGIGRFSGKNEFSDVEFLEIFKEILPHVQSGEIDLDKIKTIDMVEKMDSSFIHFGINSSGKFFMESSNSGEVTVDDYEQRFGHIYMSDYRESFSSLLKNTILQSTLKKIFKKFGAIRYDAELFPILTHTGDESGYVTFVATKYDKKKFGTKGALVVFKSWVKDENAQWIRPEPKISTSLISAIESADSTEWRIYTNEKHAKISGVVQLKAINVDKMLSSTESIDDAIEVLSSRGNTTIKSHLKNVISELKEKLQGILDKYAEETSSIFSKPDSPSSIEGVVLRIKKANGDIFEIKGTSNAFDTLKKQTWATRSSIAELEAVTEGSFLKDALGLKTSQAASLNRIIKDFGSKFVSTEKNSEKKEHEFLMKLFSEMRNSDAIVEPAETRKRVSQIFEVAKNQLSVIVDEFKSQKIDPDSKRKSLNSIKDIIEKFDSIEKTINTDMPDEAFQLYIFKFMLDRRLKQYAGQHMNAADRDYSQYYKGMTPVIIWNGRAQPWHRGHDAMIQLAKEKLDALGAEKILILIVKGGKTSLNKDENPLSEKDQKALIESVYVNDSNVVVSPTPLANGSLFAIIQKLGEMKAYMVGWLAGNDRIGEYGKVLTSFNASVWLKDHATLPIKVNSKGIADVEMIETPRVMSGTAARESAKTSDFQTWLNNVAPSHSKKNKEAVGIYKQIYQLLNSIKSESIIRDMVRNKFTEGFVLNELHPDNPEKANGEIQNLIDAYTNESDPEKKKIILAKIEKRWIGGANEFIKKIDDMNAPPEVKEKSKEIYKKLADITPSANALGNIDSQQDVGGKNISGPPADVKSIGTNQKPSTSPTPKPEAVDKKKEFEAYVKNIPKYASVSDPEKLKKFLYGSLGALSGALVWAMKAENEKGGNAAEVFFGKVSEKWTVILDKINKGKVAADEINRMVKSAASDMGENMQSYLDLKKSAMDIMDKYNIADKFEQYANPRRISAAKHNSSGKMQKGLDETKYMFLMNHIRIFASVEGLDESIKGGLKNIMTKYKGNPSDVKKAITEIVDSLGKMDLPYDVIRQSLDKNPGMDPNELKSVIEKAISDSKNTKTPPTDTETP